MSIALPGQLLIVGILLSALPAQAGEPSATASGAILVEVNTGFGEASPANTSLVLRAGGDGLEWAAGAEGGYFVADNLALKIGLGYADLGSADNVAGDFTWKVGAKYYLMDDWPLQVDVNGLLRTYGDDPDDDPSTPPVEIPDETPMYLGIQAGYAWRVSRRISIEPGLRYGLALNEDAGDSVVAFHVGFVAFF